MDLFRAVTTAHCGQHEIKSVHHSGKYVLGINHATSSWHLGIIDTKNGNLNWNTLYLERNQPIFHPLKPWCIQFACGRLQLIEILNDCKVEYTKKFDFVDRICHLVDFSPCGRFLMAKYWKNRFCVYDLDSSSTHTIWSLVANQDTQFIGFQTCMIHDKKVTICIFLFVKEKQLRVYQAESGVCMFDWTTSIPFDHATLIDEDEHHIFMYKSNSRKCAFYSIFTGQCIQMIFNDNIHLHWMLWSKNTNSNSNTIMALGTRCGSDLDGFDLFELTFDKTLLEKENSNVKFEWDSQHHQRGFSCDHQQMMRSFDNKLIFIGAKVFSLLDHHNISLLVEGKNNNFMVTPKHVYYFGNGKLWNMRQYWWWSFEVLCVSITILSQFAYFGKHTLFDRHLMRLIFEF